MSKGKYAKSVNYKPLALLLAMSLLVGCAIGGTVAWLADKTEPVKNTFTTSNVDIELAETKDTFKMIPGWTIDKDPKVTVKAGSEDCWLFVQVDESCGVPKSDDANYSFSEFLAYAIDTTTANNCWTKGKGTKSESNPDGDGIPTNVYYRKVEGATSDKEFSILAAGTFTDTATNTVVSWSANQVATKPSVTKEMMEAANKEGATKPTLTFTAYASQLKKNNTEEFTAAEAWANCPKS